MTARKDVQTFRPWRRLWPVLTLIGVPLLVSAQPPAVPQIRVLQPGDGLPPAEVARLPMAGRREIRLLRQAADYLEKDRHDEAIIYLQSILDADQDGFVDLDDDSRELTSLRDEAVRMLESLPADGRQAYELRYGGTAKALLAESLGAGDWEAIADVARRFPATMAGREARYRLARACFDRGDSLAALAGFERLLKQASPAERRLLLAQLVLCYSRVPDDSRANEVLRKLVGLGGSLRLVLQLYFCKTPAYS